MATPPGTGTVRQSGSAGKIAASSTETARAAVPAPAGSAVAMQHLPALQDDAPSLVLLHGLGFSSTVWTPLLDELRRDFHVFAPDLPGFGASAAAPLTFGTGGDTPSAGGEALLNFGTGGDTPSAGGEAPLTFGTGGDTPFAGGEAPLTFGTGGDTPSAGGEALLSALLPVLPPRALYMGWSLGGMLALQLAAEQPQRVAAVVAIGTNPCFQQRSGWEAGVPAEELQKFREIASQDWESTRRRLAALVARGEADARPLERQLQEMSAAFPPSAAGMRTGLQFLGGADLRRAVSGLQVPSLYILGAEDALVPVPALAQNLHALPGRRRIAVLRETGHAPFLSQPQTVLALLRCFAADCALLPAPATTALDRRRVLRSFARAAHSYDAAASLQREIGTGLLRLLGEQAGAGLQASCVLDLGCGTGSCLPALARACPGAQLLALDAAETMLHRAARFPGARTVCGDAEHLPLAAGSADLVFANLCFQWCTPQRVLAQAQRVLRPGGYLAFSTFVSETLWELRSAWCAVDDGVHVHRLPPPETWRRAAADHGLHWRAQELQSFCRHYATPRALALELKALGARNGAVQAGRGLSSPRRWRRMETLYQHLGSAPGLPATFEVLSGVLQKKR